MPGDTIFSSTVEPASNSVPMSVGGTYDGEVTWMDGLYFGTYDQIVNPWLSHAQISSPLFGLLYLNATAALDLPPLNAFTAAAMPTEAHRLITTTSHMTPFNRLGTDEDDVWEDLTNEVIFSFMGENRWSLQMLHHLLKFVSRDKRPGIGSWSGKPPPATFLDKAKLKTFVEQCVPAIPCRKGKDITAADAACPALPAFCQSLLAEQKKAGFAKPTASFPSVPRSWLYFENVEGARAFFMNKGLPYPDLPVDSKKVGPDGNAKQRVCTRRAVHFGARFNMAGGAAESAFVRAIGEKAFGVKPAEPGIRPDLPPAKVLLVDKCENCRIRRHILNIDEVRGVLTKYGIDFTFMSDDKINKLTLNEQTDLFSNHGLIIAPHGSALVNALFAPRRSVVIELFPYNLFCPVYWKMSLHQGRYHFPIFSKAKGPDLSFTYFRPKDDFTFMRKCEGEGLASTYYCFFEYRWQSIIVPIHQFEHTLLDALSLIGLARPPQNSTISKLHGYPDGDWGPLLVPDANYYKKNAWKLCSPDSTCVSKS
jgi:hypothetical protein